MATTLHGTELCKEFKEDTFTHFIKTRVYYVSKSLELPKCHESPLAFEWTYKELYKKDS